MCQNMDIYDYTIIKYATQSFNYKHKIGIFRIYIN